MKNVFKQRYKKGVPIREDLSHLINQNTMAATPEMLESGVLEARAGARITYHDVRLFFPAAHMHQRKDQP